MWHKAVLPALTHAAGVWFCDTQKSQKTLRSLQYKCANGVVKLHSMPARIALLGDLGCADILDHRDVLRVSYFNRLCQMEDNRIAKNVFNNLFLRRYTNGSVKYFPYLSHMKSILTDLGMEHMFYNPTSSINMNVIKY